MPSERALALREQHLQHVAGLQESAEANGDERLVDCARCAGQLGCCGLKPNLEQSFNEPEASLVAATSAVNETPSTEVPWTAKLWQPDSKPIAIFAQQAKESVEPILAQQAEAIVRTTAQQIFAETAPAREEPQTTPAIETQSRAVIASAPERSTNAPAKVTEAEVHAAESSRTREMPDQKQAVTNKTEVDAGLVAHTSDQLSRAQQTLTVKQPTPETKSAAKVESARVTVPQPPAVQNSIRRAPPLQKPKPVKTAHIQPPKQTPHKPKLKLVPAPVPRLAETTPPTANTLHFVTLKRPALELVMVPPDELPAEQPPATVESEGIEFYNKPAVPYLRVMKDVSPVSTITAETSGLLEQPEMLDVIDEISPTPLPIVVEHTAPLEHLAETPVKPSIKAIEFAESKPTPADSAINPDQIESMVVESHPTPKKLEIFHDEAIKSENDIEVMNEETLALPRKRAELVHARLRYLQAVPNLQRAHSSDTRSQTDQKKRYAHDQIESKSIKSPKFKQKATDIPVYIGNWVLLLIGRAA